MRSWALGTAEGDWVSMGIPSDGSYGIAPGVIYGYPVTVKNGKYTIVQDLPVSDFRSEEHTSELQSLMRTSYAVFCLQKKKKNKQHMLTHNEPYHITQHT